MYTNEDILKFVQNNFEQTDTIDGTFLEFNDDSPIHESCLSCLDDLAAAGFVAGFTDGQLQNFLAPDGITNADVRWQEAFLPVIDVYLDKNESDALTNEIFHQRQDVAEQVQVMRNYPESFKRAFSLDESLRKEAAASGNRTIAKWLADDENWQVRAEVARQGYALDKLVDDEDWHVREAVAKQDYALDKLANDKDNDVRKAVVIEAAKTDREDLLEKFVQDPDFEIRARVARQGYALDKLAGDEEQFVRICVANAAIKFGREDLLEKLADDEVRDVREVVFEAAEEAKRSDLMDKLIVGFNGNARRDLAIDGVALDRFAADRDPMIRRACTTGIMRKMNMFSPEYIRQHGWDKTWDKVLETLSNDGNPLVAQRARKALNKWQELQEKEQEMAARKTNNNTVENIEEKETPTQEQTSKEIRAEADEKTRQEVEFKDYVEKNASPELAAQFDDALERKPGYRTLNVSANKFYGVYDPDRPKGQLPEPITGSKQMEDGSTKSWCFYNVLMTSTAAKELGLDPDLGRWRFTANDRDVRTLPNTGTASISMREDRNIRVQCSAKGDDGKWAVQDEKKIPWKDVAQAVEKAEKRSNSKMKTLVSEKYLSGPYGEPGKEAYMWRMPRFAQDNQRKEVANMTAYIPADAVKQASFGADDAKATGTQLDDHRDQVMKYEIELSPDRTLNFQLRSERVEDPKTGKASWQQIPAERREPPVPMKFSDAAKTYKRAMADNAAYFASGAAKRDERIAEALKTAEKAESRSAGKSAPAKAENKPKARTR